MEAQRNRYKPPPTIIVRGINLSPEVITINSETLDEADQTLRFDVDINLEQFYRDNKQYTNERGWLRAQIVKRKSVSPKGHTHFMRVGTSQCRVENGVIPTKPNELR